MVIGPMAIDKSGSNPFILGLFEDSFIDPLRGFIDSLHKETDARIGVQLMYQGYYASSRLSGITPIAPSSVKRACRLPLFYFESAYSFIHYIALKGLLSQYL